MKITNHIVASAAAGAVFYSFTKSLVAAFVVFASGVFIDLDHFADYFVSVGKIKLDIGDFFEKCEGHMLKTSYLVFHSYELVFIIWVLLFFFEKNIYIAAVAVGITLHIFMDAVYKMNRYPSKPIVYSILYRALFMRFGPMPGCDKR